MRPTFPTLLLAALAAAFPPAATHAAETPAALESSPGGWTDLLADAGVDLKGWSRGPIPPAGKLKAATPSQWSLDPGTGYLVCRGDGGHEWLRWDKELGDAVFHVEWKFTPVSGKKGYNSGIYARNSDDAKVWHQAQTGDASGGFLFGETPAGGGGRTRFNLSKSVKDKRVHPAGEWNTFEITCKGKEMSLWVNGAVTCVFDDCGAPRGFVGLESEGYRIEFRSVKVKEIGKD